MVRSRNVFTMKRFYLYVLLCIAVSSSSYSPPCSLPVPPPVSSSHVNIAHNTLPLVRSVICIRTHTYVSRASRRSVPFENPCAEVTRPGADPSFINYIARPSSSRGRICLRLFIYRFFFPALSYKCTRTQRVLLRNTNVRTDVLARVTHSVDYLSILTPCR